MEQQLLSALGHPVAQLRLAWELATAPDAECHDGRRAVAEAKAALKHGESVELLDTLAAAYARNGDFDSALETQGKVLALVKSGQTAVTDSQGRLSAYEERWALYELRQPYQRD